MPGFVALRASRSDTIMKVTGKRSLQATENTTRRNQQNKKNGINCCKYQVLHAAANACPPGRHVGKELEDVHEDQGNRAHLRDPQEKYSVVVDVAAKEKKNTRARMVDKHTSILSRFTPETHLQNNALRYCIEGLDEIDNVLGAVPVQRA